MNNNENICTKENKKNELNFSIQFNNEGESFQNIIERIVLNKLLKNF